jgi:hypothetical protein
MHSTSGFDEECINLYVGYVRTTISLPEPLLKNAKRQAAQRGVPLSTVIEDALRSHLTEAPPVAGPPFRLPTFRGKLVNPELDLDRTSALVTADDESEYRGRRA